MTHPMWAGFDPMVVSVGSFQVPWSWLLYAIGGLAAYSFAVLRVDREVPAAWSDFDEVYDVIDHDLGNAFVLICFGASAGSHFGYFIFYCDWDWVASLIVRDPIHVLISSDVNESSVFGGLVGGVVAALVWSRWVGRSPSDVLDALAPVVPIALYLGRVGDFLNGHMWGPLTHSPIGMIFPNALPQLGDTPRLFGMYREGIFDSYARFPTPLFESLILAVCVLPLLWRYANRPRRRYAVFGMFALLYGTVSFGIEFIHDPTPITPLPYLIGYSGIHTDHLLSLIVAGAGAAILVFSRRLPLSDGFVAA